jgi:hypothetical protein
VQKAAGLGPLVLAARLLLEAADQRHLRQQLAAGLRIRQLQLLGASASIALRLGRRGALAGALPLLA